MCYLRYYMGFMHRFACQHGLTDDIANSKDVRHVGVHLDIDVDESLIGDSTHSLVGSDNGKSPAIRQSCKKNNAQ